MSFQDQKIQSTPEEQAKHLAAIGVMPSPVVPDLRKATTAELQEEVIFLRLFVASQMIGFKELAIKLNAVELLVKELTTRIDLVAKWQMQYDVAANPPDINYAGEAEQADFERTMEDIEKEEEQEELIEKEISETYFGKKEDFVSSLSKLDELAKEEYEPFKIVGISESADFQAD